MSGKLAVDLGYNPFRSGASIEKARKTTAVESPLFFFFSASVRRRTGPSLSLPSCSLDENQCFEIEHAERAHSPVSISSRVGQQFRIAQIATDRSSQFHQAVSSHQVLASRGGQMVDRWAQTALDPVDRLESLQYLSRRARVDGSRE